MEKDPEKVSEVLKQAELVETRISEKHRFLSQSSDELEMKLEALHKELEGISEGTPVEPIFQA